MKDGSTNVTVAHILIQSGKRKTNKQNDFFFKIKQKKYRIKAAKRSNRKEATEGEKIQ